MILNLWRSQEEEIHTLKRKNNENELLKQRISAKNQEMNGLEIENKKLKKNILKKDEEIEELNIENEKLKGNILRNHEEIQLWRRQKSIERTSERRSDLISKKNNEKPVENKRIKKDLNHLLQIYIKNENDIYPDW